LRDDETSVEHELAELVLVVLTIGVNGEGEGVVDGVDVPVVQKPLKGKIEVLEDGIGIEIDASLVLLEDGGDDRGLFPRSATILRLLDGDEIVLVTVDFGCR
jgi:hypothetical protein